MDGIGQYNGVTPNRRQAITSAMAHQYIDACMCRQASMNYSISYTRTHSVQLLHRIELVLTPKYIVNCDINQIKKSITDTAYS